MKKLTLLGVMAILCQLCFSQDQPTITLSGIVRNEAAEPLANASITIVKSNKGTISNSKGQFTLSNVSLKDQLRVTLIGYTPKIITVNNNEQLNITLHGAVSELDKVVVQAYGITSDRLRTGNISKVTAADIAKQPTMNVLNVLQGLIPGADVNNTSGFASGVVKVELRGRNLINTGFSSDPLYVIDGVPLTIQDLKAQDSYASGSAGVNQAGFNGPANGQSPLFSINPNDIESIEVLKDADATAIYGSRASNGVILITTKRGKSGKTNVDISANTGITQVIKTYDFLNTQQYIAMRREALQNDGLPINAETAADLTIWDTTRYTNWQRFLMKGGRFSDVNAVVSGGNTLTTFRISGEYQHLQDLSTYSGANQRGGMSVNLNHSSANRKFSLGLSSFYTLSKVDLKHMPYIMNLPPNAPDIWNEAGDLNYIGWMPLDNKFTFGSLLETYISKTNMFNNSLNFRFEITKGLVIRTNLGYSNIQGKQTSLTPIASRNPRYTNTGPNIFGASDVSNWIVEPQAEYNAFVSKGKLTALIGASYQNNRTSSSAAQGTGYTNDALLNSVSNAPVQIAGNDMALYKYAAVFGRVSYNWKDKYLLNLNARRDGSSKFGPGRQFGDFGSAGAAWIFTEENLIKDNLKFLSFGKLRGSFGTTGGDQIGNYQFLSRWIFGNTNLSYNGSPILLPQNHLDSLIQWQVNHKTELGIALGFFKDRLNFEASWYRNRCDNQLVPLPTPLHTGFASVLTNSPANVENKGWEFIVSAKVIVTPKFNWSVNGNISINRNRLISYPNFSQSPFYSLYEIGRPLQIARVLKSKGVDPLTGNYYFEDLNGNGKTDIDFTLKTKDDRYIIDRTPKFFGGLTNTISYKNWQLSFLLYFKKQIGLSVLSDATYPGDIRNQPVYVMQRWQKEGDITPVPKFSTNPNGNTSYSQFFRNSDGIYTDASFIRLQNLQLNFQLGEAGLQKLGFREASIYLRAQNLFVISGYDGLDPEIQSITSPPRPRTITAGIRLNL